jgi:hypothetical protein
VAMIIEEIKSIKSGRKELRNFGFTIGIALGLFGGLLLWRGKHYYHYCFIISAVFIFLGVTLPAVLKPFHKLWMTLSIFMGWFMTRVILIILFYGILTPIGLTARCLYGKDFLDKAFNKNTNSYWITRKTAEYNKKSYENQF